MAVAAHDVKCVLCQVRTYRRNLAHGLPLLLADGCSDLHHGAFDAEEVRGRRPSHRPAPPDRTRMPRLGGRRPRRDAAAPALAGPGRPRARPARIVTDPGHDRARLRAALRNHLPAVAGPEAPRWEGDFRIFLLIIWPCGSNIGPSDTPQGRTSMRMERQEVLGRAPATAQSRAAVRTPHDGASGANSLDAIRAESREPRAESREPRAESPEPRAESREPRAESREPRAESREPRAESREPRAESIPTAGVHHASVERMQVTPTA